jgi:hypothetical protein
VTERKKIAKYGNIGFLVEKPEGGKKTNWKF